MPEWDFEVARIARSQHGLVTVEQLSRLGVTRKMIRTRLASRQWIKVDRGVIRLAAVAVSWESQVLARVLSAGEGAVASHRSAAALWELDGCRKGAVEISVPRGRRYRRPGVRTYESTDLHLVAPVLRNHIPTTRVARTLLDLGAAVPLGQVHVALDSARRRGLTNWDELLGTLVAHARRGRRGVGTLRAILNEHFGEVAVTDSGFEHLVVALLREFGLPRPVLQHEVRLGERTYRLDLAYPGAMLAIELDGSVHLERRVWEADHVRQNALILAGWTVLRFTWRDYLDHPSKLVATVKVGLAGLSGRNGP